jgi:hypothetical protein
VKHLAIINNRYHDAPVTRTTVTLDPDVEQLLKEAMQARRLSFKEALNQAIRNGLKDLRTDHDPFVVAARPMGLRVGVDAGRLNQMSDELEAAAYLDLSDRLSRS